MERFENITSSRLKGIFDLLDKQEEMLVELRRTLDEEQKALNASDVMGLVEISRKKETQLLRIRRLDDFFQDSAREAINASSNKIVKLDDLRSLATDREAEMLARQRDLLEEMRDEILERNLMNKKFAQEILGFINDAIHLITGAVENNPTYSKKGATRAVSNGPSYICREV